MAPPEPAPRTRASVYPAVGSYAISVPSTTLAVGLVSTEGPRRSWRDHTPLFHSGLKIRSAEIEVRSRGGRKPNRGRRRGQPVGRWWRDDRHRWPRPFRSSSTISARASFQVQRSARRPLADRSGSPPARRLSRHGSPPAETWRLGPPRGQSRARIHRPAAGCPSGPPRPRGGSAVRGCRCPSSG